MARFRMPDPRIVTIPSFLIYLLTLGFGAFLIARAPQWQEIAGLMLTIGAIIALIGVCRGGWVGHGVESAALMLITVGLVLTISLEVVSTIIENDVLAAELISLAAICLVGATAKWVWLGRKVLNEKPH